MMKAGRYISALIAIVTLVSCSDGQVHTNNRAAARRRGENSIIDPSFGIVERGRRASHDLRHSSHSIWRENEVKELVLRELDDESFSLPTSGLDVETLAGEEILGVDPSSMADSSSLSDDQGGYFVGDISVDGHNVPVTAYKGSGNNVSVIFIGDVAIGNLSNSRHLVRTLTCAKIASVANEAAYNPQAQLAVCEFVKEHCRPNRGLINYMSVPYCAPFDRVPHAGGILLLLWTLLLLVWLAAQVDFLIPALHTVSDLFGMSQSVAGVTFLAFGNGCADLFSMLSATLSGPGGMELAVGEVLGNGMFVFCGVQGVVALVAAFRVDSTEYIRDCLVYLLSVLLTLLVLADGKIEVWEGVGLVSIYIAYVFAVLHWKALLAWAGLHALKQGDDDKESFDSEAGEPDEEGKKAMSGKVARYVRLVEASAADGPFRTLAHYLWPFDTDDVFALPWLHLCLALLRAPVVLAMKITVPVVDRNLPREGWVRPAMAVHMLFFPSLVSAFILFQDGIPDWAYQPANLTLVFACAFALGVVLAVALWFSASDVDDAPPAYHRHLGMIGFFVALVWIFATAREIVNAVLAFGVVFEVGSLILGVTVLAIGIGMQDLVTCVGIARAGLPAMAASACVGSSLMNILVGVGLSGILGASLVTSPYPLYVSIQLLTCIMFMAVSVGVALSYMAGGNFHASALFGASLVALYVLFIIVSLAVDMMGDDSLASLRAAAGQAP